MILLIDIGNSRLKWAAFDKGAICNHNDDSNQGAFFYRTQEYDKVIKAFLDDVQQSEFEPSRIMISTVGEKDFVDLLEQRLWDKYQVEVEYLIASKKFKNLRNAYIQPEMLGSDRWLGMVGAYVLQETNDKQPALCIIDCGSAITIDTVDSSGKHLGGFITPGINMMEQSLLQNASKLKSNLKEVSIIDKVNKIRRPKTEMVLADNTKTALVGGIYYSVISYIQSFLYDLDSMLDSKYKVYFTGGDAQKIMSMLDFEGYDNLVEHHLSHDLIWHGMISQI